MSKNGKSPIMSEEEMNNNVGIPVLKQLEPLIPRAISVLSQYLSGIEVNKEKLGIARDIIRETRGFEQAANNRVAQERETRNFNLKMFTIFGDVEQREEMKKLFKTSFPKLKFLET